MAAATLRSLDSVPGLSKWLLLRPGKYVITKVMEAGIKNDRLFTMSIGPAKLLIASHPETARQVLTRPGDFHKIGTQAKFWRPSIVGRLYADAHGHRQDVVSLNGQAWEDVRKVLNPAFTAQALARMVPMFAASSDKLIAEWRKSSEVDAKRDMSHFALDVLGSTVLGRDFGALDGSFTETYDAYKLVMYEQGNPIYMLAPWLEKLPLARNTRLRKAVDIMISTLNNAVKVRLDERKAARQRGEALEEARDLLDLILGPDGGPNGVLPQEGQLLPNLWIFFLAGHDTTAISLTWLMHLLARNPAVQQRARAEAQSVLDGAKDPTPEQLEQLPYISAVINEGLRVHPPVYNMMTRFAAKDTELDGVKVPEGTMISIHVGAVNRHPAVWDRPDVFDPERFLKEKAPRVFQYLPFSAGPRRCLGDRFSLMEQKTLLAKLLTQIELLPVEGAPSEVPLSGESIPLVFAQPDELKVRVRAL